MLANFRITYSASHSPKAVSPLPVLVLTIHDLGAGPPLVAKVVVVVFVVSALALAVAAVPS